MIVKNVYIFNKENKIYYSLDLPEDIAEYNIEYRLIADEGKLLTKNNKKFYTCIDITQEEYQNNIWQEVNNPEYSQEEGET